MRLIIYTTGMMIRFAVRPIRAEKRPLRVVRSGLGDRIILEEKR